ncbi:HTH domain-containing protein [Sulfitobacter brevis]|uniref:HTH domain-containing protein n=1 Tax=Sulfitobacter brevis TaxID=74348 RepID=A0A1I2CES2_9RHOB|nr:YafY family protein [Sulfitobacter brevis]SFE66764.1 HTH domain-containing protein [Sulfitobacter brevis]
MLRQNRLFEIMQLMRDGQTHRAEDIASRMGVTPRTVYRDMDTLAASGVPVSGARGVGYRLADVISLPPLTLTDVEFEALNLGLAIAGEVADAALKSAALSLAEKIDAVLPERITAEAEAWKFAVYPFADTARGIRHIATLRAAIKARQKLRLTYTAQSGTVTTRRVRPLMMEHLGRIWLLTAWCELRSDFRTFRLDLIESAEALPELFTDEAGKSLAEFQAQKP